jgi:hypothetical protein
MALALHEIHREAAAQARLLAFRLHVGAGLAHGGDDAVQRDAMAPIALQRPRRLERTFISLSQQHANYLAVP